MPAHPVDDAAAETDRDFIVADADYFEIKARQCFRLARKTHDGTGEETLKSLGRAFEAKARTLKKEDESRQRRRLPASKSSFHH